MGLFNLFILTLEPLTSCFVIVPNSRWDVMPLLTRTLVLSFPSSTRGLTECTPHGRSIMRAQWALGCETYLKKKTVPNICSPWYYSFYPRRSLPGAKMYLPTKVWQGGILRHPEERQKGSCWKGTGGGTEHHGSHSWIYPSLDTRSVSTGSVGNTGTSVCLV